MKKAIIYSIVISFILAGCVQKPATNNESVDMSQIDTAPVLGMTAQQLTAKSKTMSDMDWINFMENKVRGKKVTWEATVDSVEEVDFKGLDLSYQVKAEGGTLVFLSNDEGFMNLQKGDSVTFEGLVQQVKMGEDYIEVYPARIAP